MFFIFVVMLFIFGAKKKSCKGNLVRRCAKIMIVIDNGGNIVETTDFDSQTDNFS